MQETSAGSAQQLVLRGLLLVMELEHYSYLLHRQIRLVGHRILSLACHLEVVVLGLDCILPVLVVILDQLVALDQIDSVECSCFGRQAQMELWKWRVDASNEVPS